MNNTNNKNISSRSNSKHQKKFSALWNTTPSLTLCLYNGAIKCHVLIIKKYSNPNEKVCSMCDVHNNNLIRVFFRYCCYWKILRARTRSCVIDNFDLNVIKCIFTRANIDTKYYRLPHERLVLNN